MWVLDMWMGRAKDAQLLAVMYRMGVKWQPKILGIESVSRQIQVVDSITTFLESTPHLQWIPKVVPVDYTGARGPKAKPDRIATLEWRFAAGKIKYPAHLQNKWPFSALYSQTRDFTYDLMLLPYDDALDAVAMGHYVLHGRGAKLPEEVKQLTLAEKIRTGRVQEHGVPIISGYNAEEIDAETLSAFVDRSYNVATAPKPLKSSIPRYRRPYLGRQRPKPKEQT
jgi:hypothetical protein